VFRSIYNFFGSISLTIFLLPAIAINLAIGSQFTKHYPAVFGQLNFLRFQDWLLLHQEPACWWVWSLFFLLFLFGVNTAVCTAGRVLFLLRQRNNFNCRAFVVAVSPSLMHICFLLVIGGHAVSQFAADIRQLPISPGARMSLSPDTLAVTGQQYLYQTEPALKGRVKACTATLALTSPDGTIMREVGILHPVFWKGFSIHLDSAGKTKPGVPPQLKLIVRKDPGLYPILIGNAILCLLLLCYFPVIIRDRRNA
jgi:hypothetical protein